jgi:hypothetical protein
MTTTTKPHNRGNAQESRAAAYLRISPVDSSLSAHLSEKLKSEIQLV